MNTTDAASTLGRRPGPAGVDTRVRKEPCSKAGRACHLGLLRHNTHSRQRRRAHGRSSTACRRRCHASRGGGSGRRRRHRRRRHNGSRRRRALRLLTRGGGGGKAGSGGGFSRGSGWGRGLRSRCTSRRAGATIKRAGGEGGGCHRVRKEAPPTGGPPQCGRLRGRLSASSQGSRRHPSALRR